MAELEHANDDIALALGREFLTNLLKDRFLKGQAERLLAHEAKIAAQETRIKELEDAFNAEHGAKASAAGKPSTK